MRLKWKDTAGVSHHIGSSSGCGGKEESWSCSLSKPKGVPFFNSWKVWLHRIHQEFTTLQPRAPAVFSFTYWGVLLALANAFTVVTLYNMNLFFRFAASFFKLGIMIYILILEASFLFVQLYITLTTCLLLIHLGKLYIHLRRSEACTNLQLP